MYKYIIIDDEEILRNGIHKKVSSLNLPLVHIGDAENGEDAIALIKKEKPDIVITDMRMPVLDGKMLLKVIQNDFPDIKVLVISGFTDFEYLQEAISANVVAYLLKPFNREEMQKALEKTISLLQKDRMLEEGKSRLASEKEELNYLLDIQCLIDALLSHQTVSLKDFKSQRICTLFQDCNRFVLITCYLPSGISDDQYRTIQSSLHPQNGIVPFRHTSLGRNLIFFLCCKGTDQIKHDSLRDKVDTIRALFSHLTDEKALFVISSMKTNLTGFNDAYKECILSLDRRNILDGSGVYYLKSEDHIPKAIVWEDENQLLFHIEAGNEENAVQLLNNFFDLFVKNPDITIADVKYNCRLLYNSIRSLLQDKYADVYRTSVISGFDTAMNEIFDIDSVKSSFYCILINVIRMMKELDIYPANDLVNNIKKYLDQNYTRNFTLQKLSSLFFINPSYCSFIFKQRTGQNITDYITGLRMEKAKKMLRCTNYEIHSIAKMPGYDKTKYFFRVFKKAVGTTPDKYRQVHRQ